MSFQLGSVNRQFNTESETFVQSFNLTHEGVPLFHKTFDGSSSADVLLGDANGDSILNILDVIAVVNMVLGNIEPDLTTADLNGDGLITVLDIIQLLNIIGETNN